MNLSQLNNRKIALLGLGIENQALLKYLGSKKIICEITICDFRTDIKNALKLFPSKNIKLAWKLGKGFDAGLETFNILFRSPGWPINCPGVNRARKKGALLYSPMKLFFDLCPSKNIIGVTGTKGKGTTSSLIYAMLKEGRRRAWLGGNIGVAPFEFLPKIKKNDWIVLELSSFQLEDLHISPHVAVITNFTPEHLSAADPNNPNYHKNLNHYWASKLNIARFQKKNDSLIANINLKDRIFKARPNSKTLFFSKSNLASRLVGEHNKENIAAAVIAVRLAKINKRSIKNAVLKFKGLEHRLEFVRAVNGVKYYNDTFATTPESAITALNSFASPIILIAGGSEKGSDFRQLAKKIKSKAKLVVLIIGDATPRIKKELLKINYPKDKIFGVSGMAAAVKKARESARSGDIVLLSPACASFGIFKNYKERGKQFKDEVKKI